MNYTPGPWTYKTVPVWIPSQPTEGIPHFQCNENGGELWMKEAEANARLISAAPELLEACKRCIEWVNNPNHPEYMADQVARFKSAIAKAEGK